MNQSQSSQFFPSPIRILWIVATLLGGATIALGIGTAPPRPSILWAVKGLLVAVPLVFLAWQASVRLCIDSAGISYRSIIGGWSMLWVEVEAVFVDIRQTMINGVVPLEPTFRITLRSQGVPATGQKVSKGKFLGATFTLARPSDSAPTNNSAKTRVIGTGFGHGARIYELVNENTFQFLLRRAKDDLQKNPVTTFGPIAVGPQGLAVGDVFEDVFGENAFGKKGPEVIPWTQVDFFILEKGTLRMGRQGKRWASMPASSIPNISILMTLVEQLHPKRAVAGSG